MKLGHKISRFTIRFLAIFFVPILVYIAIGIFSGVSLSLFTSFFVHEEIPATYFVFFMYLLGTLIIGFLLREQLINNLNYKNVAFIAAAILTAFCFYWVYSGNFPLAAYGWLTRFDHISGPGYLYSLHRIHPLFPFDHVGLAFTYGNLHLPTGFVNLRVIDQIAPSNKWVNIVSVRYFIWLLVISSIHGILLATFLSSRPKKSLI